MLRDVAEYTHKRVHVKVDMREQNTGLTALTQYTRLVVFRCSGEDGSSGFRPVHLTDKLNLPGS